MDRSKPGRRIYLGREACGGIMKTKLSISTLFAIILAAILTGCSILGGNSGNSLLTGSGTIEADTIRLAPEIGGKIAEISVNKGDSLQAGDKVFRLDDTAYQAQRSQAQAAVQAVQSALAAAQANLDLLKAGATDEQLNAAEAQLAQADANRQATQATLNFVTSGQRPEDIAAAQTRLEWARQEYYSMTVVLDAKQIEDVHTAVTQAQSNLDQAKNRKTELEKDQRTPASALDASTSAIADVQSLLDITTQAYQVVQDATKPFYLQIAAVRKSWEVAQLNRSQATARQSSLQADTNMTQDALDAAQSTINDAQTMIDKTKAAYDALNTGDQASRLTSAWTEVQNAQTNIDSLGRNTAGAVDLVTLLNQLNAATAARDTARANLANLKNGARPEQIAAAQAQVDAAKAQLEAAKAALNLVDIQIGKLSVAAPAAGVVLDRPLNAGEIAAAGATIVEIGSLDKVTLTVYVPEDQYGRIKLGQKATIKIDSYPGKTFEGTVEYISDQAEFTPRNVQTVESRSTTVYAIKIGIPNPDHTLKPGMPADASF
jgi:multidrug resistance efflux pump